MKKSSLHLYTVLSLSVAMVATAGVTRLTTAQVTGGTAQTGTTEASSPTISAVQEGTVPASTTTTSPGSTTPTGNIPLPLGENGRDMYGNGPGDCTDKGCRCGPDGCAGSNDFGPATKKSALMRQVEQMERMFGEDECLSPEEQTRVQKAITKAKMNAKKMTKVMTKLQEKAAKAPVEKRGMYEKKIESYKSQIGQLNDGVDTLEEILLLGSCEDVDIDE